MLTIRRTAFKFYSKHEVLYVFAARRRPTWKNIGILVEKNMRQSCVIRKHVNIDAKI